MPMWLRVMRYGIQAPFTSDEACRISASLLEYAKVKRDRLDRIIKKAEGELNRMQERDKEIEEDLARETALHGGGTSHPL